VGTCFVCKRRHDNIGFQRSRSHPIRWFCRTDSEFIKEAAALPRKSFDIYETQSLQAGGIVACQYLDSIGQTDMAELDANQWLLFFTKFSGGYEDSMRKIFMGEK
jgi:hypothetical protein